VIELLRERFDWRQIVELGDLSTARGAEMFLPLWISMMGALKTPQFNSRLVR
jgi:hypothetical protein